jgi:hypothetical protein
VPHTFHNAGTERARLLIGFTPAGMEPFFEAFAALDEGADRREQFARLGREVGMDVVGPPLAISDPV